MGEGRVENLKHFSSTYQPKNRGRKPSKLKWLQKQYQYSSDDLKAAISATEAMPVEKLKALSKDEKADVCMRTIAIARLKAMTKGDLKQLEILWDRAYGRPKQEIEQTNKNLEIKDLPPEERTSLMNGLLEKYRKVKEFNNGDNNQTE